MHPSSSMPWLVALVVAAFVVCTYFAETVPITPFAYDEADYMYAATRGLINNYLDRPSMDLATFVRRGLELSRDNAQRGNISQLVRSSGDINFYRHYHGPMYAYWIGLCKLAGLRGEVAYRASGLLIHVVSTFMIFLFFRAAFPALAPIAAFMAALAFLLNRTALVSSTAITQHVLFTLFAGLTLFLMAQYVQELAERYWYATVAALALAVCTVETSFILAGIIVLLRIFTRKELEWKHQLQQFVRGLGVFLLTVLVVWPNGLLRLNLPKGYLYLAYMAIRRKTFTPISPAALWMGRLRSYPLEFVSAALVLAGCILFLRTYHHRRETIPFLAYTLTFVAITMVITLPYTYYYGSLFLCSAVLTGIVFGEIWIRVKLATRVAVTVATLAVLTGMAVDYYREAIHPTAAPEEATVLNYIRSVADLLEYLRARPVQNATLYVPYTFIPSLHYYHPDVRTEGYDVDWTPNAIATAVLDHQDAALFCAARTCTAIKKEMPASVQFSVEEVSPTSETGEPLYSAHIVKR